jgi:hypothetical protein
MHAPLHARPPLGQLHVPFVHFSPITLAVQSESLQQLPLGMHAPLQLFCPAGQTHAPDWQTPPVSEGEQSLSAQQCDWRMQTPLHSFVMPAHVHTWLVVHVPLMPQSALLQQPAAPHAPLQMPGMPEGHWHVPLWQVWPVTAVHSESEQQLVEEMHVPLHDFWPVGQTQLPAVQTTPASPQSPSVQHPDCAMHAPLHGFVAGGHAHAPA